MTSVKEQEAIRKLMVFLQEWDSAHKVARSRILDNFIKSNDGKTEPELELEFSQGASLFLARLTAWLRMTYMYSTCLNKVLKSIGIFLSAASGCRYLIEFLEIGGVSILLEILGLNHLKEEDKRDSVKLLQLIADAGGKYKELICDSYRVRSLAEFLASSNSAEAQEDVQVLLDSLGRSNPKYQNLSTGGPSLPSSGQKTSERSGGPGNAPPGPPLWRRWRRGAPKRAQSSAGPVVTAAGLARVPPRRRALARGGGGGVRQPLFRLCAALPAGPMRPNPGAARRCFRSLSPAAPLHRPSRSLRPGPSGPRPGAARPAQRCLPSCRGAGGGADRLISMSLINMALISIPRVQCGAAPCWPRWTPPPRASVAGGLVRAGGVGSRDEPVSGRVRGAGGRGSESGSPCPQGQQPRPQNASPGVDSHPAVQLLKALMACEARPALLQGLVALLTPPRKEVFTFCDEMAKGPTALCLKEPALVYVQQAAAAKAIGILAKESTEVAEELIQLKVVPGLMIAVGNLDHVASQRHASISLEISRHFVHTFPFVEECVKKALGQTLFQHFMLNTPETWYSKMDPVQAEELASHIADFPRDMARMQSTEGKLYPAGSQN
ncbi:armadillo-like helical domain containing protein 1 [Nyctibius grandis]|uniref:armadillo-like helical domain containing protein 1 n=1 Tax=Nyctibius grandis TaxID=48427 RepID=UPI0035BC0507